MIDMKRFKDYNNGTSLRQLEKKYGYCRRIISNILKENNITIRDNTLNSRKYTHNENFFEVIDTEEKAYWLGFIYADGFIESKRINSNQKFGITLNSIDHNHLEKFKKSIEATNPINIYKGSGYNKDSNFSRILLTSQKTVNDLINKGCLEHKTHLLEFPTIEQVPEELMRHFIRGYFDGDGSLNFYSTTKRQYKIGFVGTKNFLTGIMNHFNKNLKMSTKDDITFQLNIGGNKQVINIMNYLYKDAHVYLDRKYKKYLEMLKYNES